MTAELAWESGRQRASALRQLADRHNADAMALLIPVLRGDLKSLGFQGLKALDEVKYAERAPLC